MYFKPLLIALAACASLVQAADTPGSNPSTPKISVNERLGTARTAIAAKDWSRAVSELSTAAREEPRNADVHNLLGYSYRKRSTPDISKAFEHYYTALKLDPRHKGAHEYIGEAYLMEKRPLEAEKHLAELEKICGNKTCAEYADLSKSIVDFKAKN